MFLSLLYTAQSSDLLDGQYINGIINKNLSWIDPCLVGFIRTPELHWDGEVLFISVSFGWHISPPLASKESCRAWCPKISSLSPPEP